MEARDLENAVRDGERRIVVGCSGCSLWVIVTFEVENEG